MKLSDVVGIITGSAGGLGRGFAEKILEAGGRVVLTDINGALLEATGSELAETYSTANVAWMQQDVCERGSFERVFAFAEESLGVPINVLVNNAGVNGDRSYLQDLSSHKWEKLVEIDLISVMRGTQTGLGYMKAKLQGEPGVIINVASAAGLFPLDALPEYTAAKHGVIGLTRACAAQQQSINVRVVALCPMYAKTAMGTDALEWMPEDVKQAGGLLEVDDVSKAFVMAMENERNAGHAIWITMRGAKYYPFPTGVTVFTSNTEP